ncbi:MAG: AEC family transporter, partial [Oscillospiraceae bacterium]|nr:AEC family transporter [Oscillospiraceae bacterium]
SWGLYILIPKDENATLLKKIKTGLLAPPTIGLLLGMILGILNFKEVMPEFLLTALDNAGKCQGPVAMILAGFVIGGYKMKGLLLNKKVYVATALRLIVIPAVLMLVLKLFNVSEEIMILALIAFATPFGLNTIIYPAAYGGETETGASMAMVSHIFAVATIPIMYLVFIVLM